MSTNRTRVTIGTLGKVVEFDQPFTVHEEGGYISFPEGVYAPSVCGDPETGTESIDDAGWEFASRGYTGQHGADTNDPGMHDSELLSGRLAGDILETPGTYVLVAVYWPAEENPESNSTDVEPGDYEGWVVVRQL